MGAEIQQIIPPVKTIHGYLTQCLDDFTLILYPFIEGHDGFTSTLTDEQWLKLGKTLKQIHEIDVPSSIKRRIREEAYSSKWREIVRSLYTHVTLYFYLLVLAFKSSVIITEDKLSINFVKN